MKLQAIKMVGGKYIKCGYDKCVDALEFHHGNPKEKDFKLGSAFYMIFMFATGNVVGTICEVICFFVLLTSYLKYKKLKTGNIDKISNL